MGWVKGTEWGGGDCSTKCRQVQGLFITRAQRSINAHSQSSTAIHTS